MRGTDRSAERGRGVVYLGDVFDRHPNALNLVRLVLALEVLVWHSYSLQGHPIPERLQWFASDVGVDTFFAISGFLICRAWLRRPDLGAFLAARARRILPGLWVCLAVTAFVVVPAACWVSGRPGPSLGGSIGFVVHNAGIAVNQWGIDGTNEAVNSHGWNGSLWTLMWECFGYLLIAALGIAGLLRRRVVLTMLAAAWTSTAAIGLLGITPYMGPIWLWMPPRAGLMFLTGATLWLCRDRVPLDRHLAGAAVIGLLVSVVVLPDYRLIGAPALAYLAVWVAVVLGRHERFVLRTDLSYGVYIYGFPIQQALLLVGFDVAPWPVLLLVSVSVVLPVAAASWVLVERPASKRRISVVAGDAAGARLRADAAYGRMTAPAVAGGEPGGVWGEDGRPPGERDAAPK